MARKENPPPSNHNPLLPEPKFTGLVVLNGNTPKKRVSKKKGFAKAKLNRKQGFLGK